MRVGRDSYRNFNSHRVFVRRPGETAAEGRYVLYWMQIHRRLHYNHALEYAIGWANALGKPLLIMEALRLGYPWAQARFHTFLLEGMAEHRAECDRHGINYHSYVEKKDGDGSGLLTALAAEAALVVSDEFPVYIIPGHNRGLTRMLDRAASGVPFVTIDANGLIPMVVSPHAPYSAHVFRRTLQKHFSEALRHAPLADPLTRLQNRTRFTPAPEICARYPEAGDDLRDVPALVRGLALARAAGPLADTPGTRAAGLKKLRAFIATRLSRYQADRSHPDRDAGSGLSPYLHFGKLSAFEITQATLECQPPGWSVELLRYNEGSKGFFSTVTAAGDGGVAGDANIDDFLDELLTWRELGYHFAHHQPGYARYESLPDWARTSLGAHAADPRPYVYERERLEGADTHDPIWNAAQRQLLREGVIHNYLRMLWGKKILEWSPEPRAALENLIELNNKYSIDGRNPNSYSGIFWTLGRFDRPWQERAIFGTVRYMSSDQARKKIRMDEYLRRFGDPGLF